MPDAENVHKIPIVRDHNPENMIDGVVALSSECYRRLRIAIDRNEDIRATFAYLRNNDGIEILEMDFTVPGLAWDKKGPKHRAVIERREHGEFGMNRFETIRNIEAG